MSNPPAVPSSEEPLPLHLRWPVILISLCFCWPVGLFLLFPRLKRERRLHMVAGTIMLWVGIAWAAFFGLLSLAGLTKGDKDSAWVLGFITVLVFVAGGVAVALKGKKMKAKAQEVRRYIDLIVNQGQTSVDSIASVMGRSDLQNVTSEIQGVIDAGFLKGYSLNRETRTISRLGRPVAMVADTAPVAPPVVFTCKACGARNQVPASSGGICCEYCETPQGR